MAELDPELFERVARWCAEAGRQAGEAEIRAALAPLGWDELLLVKALLADPPPARPLGPFALADVARGAPADVAAERERGGMYRRADEEPSPEPPAAGTPTPRAQGRKAAARARPAAVVIRRARDRAAGPEQAAPPLPLLDELRLPAGRAALERMVRRHGGRRAVIARELAAGYRRADGAPVVEEDLAALLDLHGALRAFERRERDEVLHVVRAAGGVLVRAAERLGLEAPGLGAAVDRLGLAAEVERIREERRAELRARGLLSERVHLLLDDPVRLEDLGLLDEVEADLRARLPEHVRALRAAPGPLGAALGASLSLDRDAVEALAARLGLAFEGPSRGPAGASRTPPPPRTPAGGSRAGGPRGGTGGWRTPSPRPPSTSSRPGTTRPSAPSSRPRRDGPRAPMGLRPRPNDSRRQGAPPRSGTPGRAARPGAPTPPREADRARGPAPGRPSDERSSLRPSGPRSGARPSGPRGGARFSDPRSGARPSGPRSGARPSDPRSGARSSDPRSGARSSGPRSGARPSGPRSTARPSGPRSGARPSGPRSTARPSSPRGGARPSGPRRPPRRK